MITYVGAKSKPQGPKGIRAAKADAANAAPNGDGAGWRREQEDMFLLEGSAPPPDGDGAAPNAGAAAAPENVLSFRQRSSKPPKTKVLNNF